MKKNKMMRLASWLMVLTLLTTCIISGTFAKYVTSDSAGDTARVAKWGVVASISGSLFGEHYTAFEETESGEAGNKISASYTGSVDSKYVESSNGNYSDSAGEGGNIVAPGTKGENLTISVSGTPEVRSKVEVTVDETNPVNFSDIWLHEGTYGIMVPTTVENGKIDGLYVQDDNGAYQPVGDSGYDSGEKYYKLINEVDMGDYIGAELDSPRFIGEEGSRLYTPIKWTLSSVRATEEPPVDVNDGLEIYTVKDITKAINDSIKENNDSSNTFDSLTNLAGRVGNITINWEWPYEELDSDGEQLLDSVDGLDTILGSLIALKDNAGKYDVVQIGDNSVLTTLTVGVDNSDGVTYAYAGKDQVACLTVGFNVKVTVSQVD